MTNLGHWADILEQMAEEVRYQQQNMAASGRATKRAIAHVERMADHLERAAQEIRAFLKLQEAVMYPVWDVADEDTCEEAKDTVVVNA
ncbi:MAG TPA: hypothetical protein VIK98_03665 [Limnochordales bacterium]